MIKYTTLWEILMKDFDAESFTHMTILLGHLIGGGAGVSTTEYETTKIYEHPIEKQGIHSLILLFTSYEQTFIRLNLPMSAVTTRRLIDALSDTSSTLQDIDVLYKELRGRLKDELRSHKFFFLEPDKEQFLLEQELFGTKVTTAFPSAIIDIEEAGKCIAFERWTAAVFHLSRVAEIAVVSIGKRVAYSSPKEGFGEVLNYLDAGLAKARKDYKNADPLFIDDLEFLSGVTAMMHAVNQAWRQRVAHLDKKYTEEEALRIWNATKGLLQQMATKLTETPND